MRFEEVLHYLREGMTAYRKEWDNKEIGIMEGYKSIKPNHETQELWELDKDNYITINPYFAIIDRFDNSITQWNPSGYDIIVADDWYLKVCGNTKNANILIGILYNKILGMIEIYNINPSDIEFIKLEKSTDDKVNININAHIIPTDINLDDNDKNIIQEKINLLIKTTYSDPLSISKDKFDLDVPFSERNNKVDIIELIGNSIIKKAKKSIKDINIDVYSIKINDKLSTQLSTSNFMLEIIGIEYGDKRIFIMDTGIKIENYKNIDLDKLNEYIINNYFNN